MRLITSSHTRAEARPCVLLISPHSSYRIAPYFKAAEKLNIEMIVVSEGKHSVVSAIASGIHVDFSDTERACKHILESVRHKTISGVIGTDDATVELASAVARSLSLVHNDPKAALLSRRKDQARGCLQQAGLPVPGFECIGLLPVPDKKPDSLEFPLVVKPVCLSGSRGVIRVNNHEEFVSACNRIKKILAGEQGLTDWECSHALVEEYIPGQEFAFEGILQGGKLHQLALFDKPDLMEGPFFEETYYILPSGVSVEKQQEILETVEKVCAAYGLREGPVHAEMRLAHGKVWMMEMASRTIGGQCARLLRFGTGASLEEIVLSYAVGEPIPIEKIDGAAGVLMIPVPGHGILRRVEGLMRAEKVPGIVDIEISVPDGYELVPLPEGASYLGFIFSRTETAEQAEQALRNAYGQLNVVLAPILAYQSGAV